MWQEKKRNKEKGRKELPYQKAWQFLSPLFFWPVVTVVINYNKIKGKQ